MFDQKLTVHWPFYLAAKCYPLIARSYFQYCQTYGVCCLSAFVNQQHDVLTSKKLREQIQAIDWRYIDSLVEELHAKNISLCCLEDALYPEALKHIASPPLVLFTQGEQSLLQMPSMAIVGTRKPSPIAQTQAAQFARGLSERFVISSGMALGVDGIAHRATLDVSGKTIAVLGSGFDHIYPAAHRNLYKDIIDKQGLVITEHLPHEPPKASHFPQRNRIISGISQGVLVVEAAVKSGSLITARLAAEQGREVFALPCAAQYPGGQGGLKLIQEGAKLVINLEDILTELGVTAQGQADVEQSNTLAATEVSKDVELMQLMPFFSQSPVSAEELVDKSGLAFDKVCSILLRLELMGRVKPVAAGYIAST